MPSYQRRRRSQGFPVRPATHSLRKRPECQTESNAFRKSMKATYTGMSSLLDSMSKLMRMNNCSRLLLPFWDPACRSKMTLNRMGWSRSWRIFSRSLARELVSVTGRKPSR
eukprot:Lithocolla_globosa_v1_NODE_1850_length_2298_cov_3.220241.p4 type:complete len:111 gc:universal NODE_1850_length_2298_cov_3.220241:832-1164(+)